MRRRAAFLALAIGVASALFTALLAAAQVVERVQVGDPSRTTTAGLPPSLSLVLASPPDYTATARRSEGGSWAGPRYQTTYDPAVGGTASIEWNVRFEQVANTEATAGAAVRQGWPEDQRGGISVPRRVGGRLIGTIHSFYVLKYGPPAQEAAFDGAVAIPLPGGVHAIVRFELLEPASNSAGPLGAHHVQGVTAQTWNRGQALQALAGISLEGNLPPSLVSLRVVRGRRLLRGRVIDSFRHPVVGVRLRVERYLAGTWHQAVTGKTDRKGLFSLAVPTRGRYRVVATLGALTAQSGSVPVR